MLKVIVTNNTNREATIVDGATTTPREIFESKGFQYETSQIFLDGCTVRPGDIDRTFTELGIVGDKVSLAAMAKVDNAR